MKFSLQLLKQKMPFDRGYNILFLLLLVETTAAVGTNHTKQLSPWLTVHQQHMSAVADSHDCGEIISHAKKHLRRDNQTSSEFKQEICDAILASEICQITDSHINYINFMYCSLRASLSWYWLTLGSVVCVIWASFLFLIEGIVAECLFCPNLEVVSKMLRLSQGIAGVTLLAFGNGAPDVFSCIAAVKHAATAQPTLILGSLLGGGMFITCIIAGTIYRANTFQVARRPFLRDVVFYMADVCWILTIIHRGHVSQIEAIGFLMLYIGYVISVVISRVLWVKWLQRKRARGGSKADRLRAQQELREQEEENRAVTEVLRPTRLSYLRAESLAGSFRRRQLPRHQHSRVLGGADDNEQLEMGITRGNIHHRERVYRRCVTVAAPITSRVQTHNLIQTRSPPRSGSVVAKDGKNCVNPPINRHHRRPTIAFGELSQWRTHNRPPQHKRYEAQASITSSSNGSSNDYRHKIIHAAQQHIYAPIRRVVSDVNVVAHQSLSWLKLHHKHGWHMSGGSFGAENSAYEHDHAPTAGGSRKTGHEHPSPIKRTESVKPRVLFHLGRTLSDRSLVGDDDMEVNVSRDNDDNDGKATSRHRPANKHDDGVLIQRRHLHSSLHAVVSTGSVTNSEHGSTRKDTPVLFSLPPQSDDEYQPSELPKDNDRSPYAPKNSVTQTSLHQHHHQHHHANSWRDLSHLSIARSNRAFESDEDEISLGRGVVTPRPSPHQIVLNKKVINELLADMDSGAIKPAAHDQLPTEDFNLRCRHDFLQHNSSETFSNYTSAASDVTRNGALPPLEEENGVLYGNGDVEVAIHPTSNNTENNNTPELLPWWRDIFEHIWPVSGPQWRAQSWGSRIFTVIRVPVGMILFIITPLVDDTEVDTRNWCKWLQVWQLAATPALCTLAFAGIEPLFFGVPLVVPVAGLSCTAALLLATCTSRERPPRGHGLFAVLGFLMAVSIVFKMANEVVGVLIALGAVFGLSPAMLGISLLAWGNNVPDLVANVLLSRRGFPRVAVSACYAGPLFSAMVGLGIGFAIGTSSTPDRKMYFKADLVSSLVGYFVLGGLVLTVIYMSLQKFSAKKWFGWSLHGLYVVFILFLFLTELKVW